MEAIDMGSVCIGSLHGEKYPHTYLVIVNHVYATKELRCSILKNRYEVEVRTYANKEDFTAAFLPFFGQEQIDKVKFRDEL